MQAQEKAKEWVELALVVSALAAVSALGAKVAASEKVSEKALEKESVRASHKRIQVQLCRMRQPLMPNRGPRAPYRSQARLGNH